jgi:hypothetical protein
LRGAENDVSSSTAAPLVIYAKYDSVQKWRWTLWQYVSANGRKAIDDWRDNLPPGSAMADLDNFLSLLARMSEWAPPDIRLLHGKQSGLSELRWTSGKVEHRIVGYRQPDCDGRHQYVMVIGCTHKGRVYKPADALATAVSRKRQIERGEATTSEYSLVADH